MVLADFKPVVAREKWLCSEYLADGILLFANKKMPMHLLIIPLLWSIIGFIAAFTLTIYEDIGLIVAGVAAFGLLIISNKNYKAVED